jgi:exodeoxyribonuclease-3
VKIVTWNVNSLKARAEYVDLYLEHEDADVICIQELKLETDKVPGELFTARGYPHLAVFGQKQWNGVMIASKLPLTDVHTGLPGGDDDQSRLIAATVGGLRLVNLYCPQGQSADSPKFAYKLRFFATLNAWLRERCDPAAPLVLTGDLNIAPNPDDVWDVALFEGVPTYHPREHEAWAELLAFGLSDVARPHLPDHSYTFWDYRRARFRFNQGMRIDHFLATAPVAARVAGAQVQRDWRKQRGAFKASDHAPVMLELADAGETA